MRNYENLYKNISIRDLLVSSRFGKKIKEKEENKTHWCRQAMDRMLFNLFIKDEINDKSEVGVSYLLYERNKGGVVILSTKDGKVDFSEVEQCLM